MKDIDRLTKTFDKLGIEYCVRNNKQYQYLFIGDRRDLYAMDGNRFKTWFEDDIDTLTRRHKYFEFEDGMLVSYPNS